jgi:hypothetical protein
MLGARYCRMIHQDLSQGARRITADGTCSLKTCDISAW